MKKSLKYISMVWLFNIMLYAGNTTKNSFVPINVGDITIFIPYNSASHESSLSEVLKPTITLAKNEYSTNDTIETTIKHIPTLNGSRPWVGLYKKGVSSAPKNLIYYDFTDQSENSKLSLINNGGNEALKEYKALKSDSDEYEIRMVAFVDNKYVTYTTAQIKIYAGSTITLAKNEYSTNDTIETTIKHIPTLNGSRPWVGLYKKGVSSAPKNLIYYDFTDQSENSKLSLINNGGNEALKEYKALKSDSDEYEIRMVAFVDNKYVTYTTAQIKIKVAPFRTEIHENFNSYYKKMKNSLERKLKKDKDGWNDTYVLYDLQTYFQNSIIYADENHDKEMIKRLLELVLLPFKEQYMTDGKWLNNRNSVPNHPELSGVEVDLPLSQYFSLLTRVLLVANKNDISVNLTEREIDIIIAHIDTWLNKDKINDKFVQHIIDGTIRKEDISKIPVRDRHMFITQSVLQFTQYSDNNGINIGRREIWKKFAQNYTDLFIEKKWEDVECQDENDESVDNCLALDRTSHANYQDFAYAGYSNEIVKENSNTNEKAMFNADKNVKQPKNPLEKVGGDISHSRRYNWFFETVLRYGEVFDVTISEERLQGWANNLAYRVCRGSIKNPKFTIFSDGIDGWYRVNYNGRKGFGYTTGDMDIHFVASSYGIMGIYNPKIYTWMKAWVKKDNNSKMKYDFYWLDYYTSMGINIKKSIE